MAVVGQIQAVRIIYDNKERNLFNLLAELFRLIGLYVEEEPLEGAKSTAERRNDPRSLSLCISSGMEGRENIFYVDPARSGVWDMSCVGACLPLFNGDVMEHFRGWLADHGLQFPCDLLEEIFPIYIRNNVLKGAMQLQYYRMKTDLHQETERIFLDTLRELETLKTESKHLAYAKIYCKQKANLSCYFQNDKPLDYAISTLMRECDDLIKKHPDFSNTKVLKGMICERSSDGLKLAIDSYREALYQIGEKRYAAHIYYWVGLLYDKFVHSHKDAAYAFERSYALQKKYRNVYKMGFMAEKEKDYPKAVFYYKECVELLDTKIRGHMDPLEIEYYFKTGVLICFHSQRYLEDYEQAIWYGEKMLDFYEKEFSNVPNEHFQYLYGECASNYQEVSKERLKCKRVYECLAIAYRETGDMEKSMEYWKLSEQL